MILRLTIVFIACSMTIGVIAQNTFQPKSVNLDYKGIIYRNEWSVDFRLHTNGAAISYNTGRIDAFNKTSYYHFELGYMTDFRERKTTRSFQSGSIIQSRTFIFGKQNNVINLRAGKGWKRYVSEKARRQGIAVGYSYEVGPSLALVKPYYINVRRNQIVEGQAVVSFEDIKFTEEDRDVFLNNVAIQGSSGYWRGFNEISVIPGVQAKGGVLFSLGAYDQMVKAIEVGAMLDVYIQSVPIMVQTENVRARPYFFNFYVSMQLGKRSN